LVEYVFSIDPKKIIPKYNVILESFGCRTGIANRKEGKREPGDIYRDDRRCPMRIFIEILSKTI
jgi:hypothetical protein